MLFGCCILVNYPSTLVRCGNIVPVLYCEFDDDDDDDDDNEMSG